MKATQLLEALEDAVNEHGDFNIGKNLSRKIRQTNPKNSHNKKLSGVSGERAADIEIRDGEPSFSEFLSLVEAAVEQHE